MNPRPRIPVWLRTGVPATSSFGQTQQILRQLRLHTVCQSARCPNHGECWNTGTATFMIGGDRCTRNCRFCAVTTARPFPLDPGEPERVAEAAGRMKLRHVVLTAVARDDLPDGGADHFRRTILALHQTDPSVLVEVLVPDFNDDDASLQTVLSARPEIFNHNLETVRRLTPRVRSRATFDRSLSVLGKVKRWSGSAIRTKSGLMLGLGETEDEVFEALRELRSVGCDMLTLGQYLQPSLKHLEVREYITPERFAAFGERARALGFAHVASAPLVRSSYHAAEFSARADSVAQTAAG